MASLGEVYGTNFHENAVKDKAIYAVKLYANNIAHKQFSFRNDSSEMWIGANMKPDIIKTFISQVTLCNTKIKLVHINKLDQSKLNMFPYLINGPVEYFIVIDMSPEVQTQLYSIYITPSQMEPF